MTPKIKEMILSFLRSQRLMTLAVTSPEPWVCTTFYYVDDDFKLYILTSPKTKHGQLITKNPHVACNIFDSQQKVTERKVGVQLKGTAKKLRAIDKLKWALNMWNTTHPDIETIINFDNIKKKIISGTIYQICPSTIQFFNEELYGEKEFTVFKL
jgi:uncharacterized protein YhbP (UPF0306 family)